MNIALRKLLGDNLRTVSGTFSIIFQHPWGQFRGSHIAEQIFNEILGQCVEKVLVAGYGGGILLPQKDAEGGL